MLKGLALAEQLGEVAADPRLAVRYCNGPLMEAHDGVTVLATFESELRGRRNKYPAEMRGTAAIVSTLTSLTSSTHVQMAPTHPRTIFHRQPYESRVTLCNVAMRHFV